MAVFYRTINPRVRLEAKLQREELGHCKTAELPEDTPGRAEELLRRETEINRITRQIDVLPSEDKRSAHKLEALKQRRDIEHANLEAEAKTDIDAKLEGKTPEEALQILDSEISKAVDQPNEFTTEGKGDAPGDGATIEV